MVQSCQSYFLFLGVVASLGCGRVDYNGDGGAGDAGPVDAGPPRTFCDQLGGDWGYNYCRDFDDTDEPFEFGWDRRVIEAGGDVRQDSSAYSAPAALLATAVDPGDGTCVNAFSEANATGAIDHTGLFFQVRMGSMDDTEAFAGAFMGLRLLDESEAEECSLVIYGDGASGGVVENAGGMAIDHPFTVRFPLQFEWTLVVMNVDHEAQTFDLTVNGDTVFSGTQTLSAACTLTGHVAVAPGIHCAPELPVGSGEVRIDDLRISYNPL